MKSHLIQSSICLKPWARKTLRMGTAMAAVMACALMPAFSHAQQKVTLRVASFMPPQGFLNQAIVIPFLDRVVADSQGTLEYKFYPGGTLGRAPAEQIKLVQDGTADIAIVIPSYTPGAYEDFDVSQLPGMAKDTRSASMGLWRVHEAGLLPTPDKVKWLGIVTTASNVLHTRKSTPTVAAVASQKVRASGSIQMGMIDALGGAAVGNIRGPEIAEGLSRNLLDGVLMDWIGIKEFRVDKLTPHHIDYDFGRLATTLAINADKLNGLPPAAKAAFAKHGGLAYAQAGGKAFDDAVNEYRAEYLKTGEHKAGNFPAADLANIPKMFTKVVNDWVKAAPNRDKVVDAFRKGVAQ